MTADIVTMSMRIEDDLKDEGRQDGSTEEWQDGRMAVQKNGRKVGW